MSMNFTSESFKKTFVRSINAALKQLSNTDLAGDYIKNRIMYAYDKYLFSCLDFDNNGLTFDISLNDSASVVYLANNVIWLFNGYYITHSSNKNTGEVCFTLRKLNEQVWNNFKHHKLIGIRVNGMTVFFGSDKGYNNFIVPQKGDVSTYDNYVCFDVTDCLYANLRPSELKLEAVIDNSYNDYGLKLEISITRPELDNLLICATQKPQNSKAFFRSLVEHTFVRLMDNGAFNSRSQITYYKV